MAIIFGRACESGTCKSPCPPPCPSISSVQCRSRSASKTKCGFAEYAGYESTPPKRYLTKTLSGSETFKQFTLSPCTGDCAEKTILDWSGDCTYSRPGCTFTTGGSMRTREYSTPDAGTDCTELLSDFTESLCSLDGGSTLPSGTETFTATTRTITGDGCNGESFEATGTATETLSVEYTTADLHNDTAAATDAAAWSAYGSCGLTSFTDYSTDELTVSMRAVAYKFNFSGATPAGCKLTFNIRNYPSGTLLAPNCINLATGISSYEYILPYPGTPGEIYVDGWAIVHGAC